MTVRESRFRGLIEAAEAVQSVQALLATFENDPNLETNGEIRPENELALASALKRAGSDRQIWRLMGADAHLSQARAYLAELFARHQAATAHTQREARRAELIADKRVHAERKMEEFLCKSIAAAKKEVEMQRKNYFDVIDSEVDVLLGSERETEEAQRETQEHVTTALRSSIQRWEEMMPIKDTQLRFDASSSLASNLHHGLYELSPTQRIECLVRKIESPFSCVDQENGLRRKAVEDEVQVEIRNSRFAT